MSILDKTLVLLYERMRTGTSTEDDVLFVAKLLVGLTRENNSIPSIYDKNIGDDTICVCGHPYYRHFVTYENRAAVGCKYCDCFDFKEKQLD